MLEVCIYLKYPGTVFSGQRGLGNRVRTTSVLHTVTRKRRAFNDRGVFRAAPSRHRPDTSRLSKKCIDSWYCVEIAQCFCSVPYKAIVHINVAS